MTSEHGEDLSWMALAAFYSKEKKSVDNRSATVVPFEDELFEDDLTSGSLYFHRSHR